METALGAGHLYHGNTVAVSCSACNLLHLTQLQAHQGKLVVTFRKANMHVRPWPLGVRDIQCTRCPLAGRVEMEGIEVALPSLSHARLCLRGLSVWEPSAWGSHQLLSAPQVVCEGSLLEMLRSEYCSVLGRSLGCAIITAHLL